MPRRMTNASAQKTAIPRMKSTLRERTPVSSSFSTGISRQRHAISATDRPRKPSRIPTSHPVIPRSMKEWTEKSARMPERVRNVPYRIVTKARQASRRLTFRCRFFARWRKSPWTSAAVQSHGTRLVFSTGSHPQ